MEVRLPKTLRRTSRSPPETNVRLEETWGLKALKTYRSLAEDALGCREGKASLLLGEGKILICHCQSVPGPCLLTSMKKLSVWGPLRIQTIFLWFLLLPLFNVHTPSKGLAAEHLAPKFKNWNVGSVVTHPRSFSLGSGPNIQTI